MPLADLSCGSETDSSCRAKLRTLLDDDELLDQAYQFQIVGDCHKGLVGPYFRVSNLYMPHIGTKGTDEPLYYIHSTYPTTSDSVFFGPDTYLYLDYLKFARSHFTKLPQNILDMCCGAGAGAIHLQCQFRDATTVYGLDLNPKALELASTNATHAGVPQVQFIESNLYSNLPGSVRGRVDMITSNPPYIATAPVGDEHLSTYADGGSKEGLELAIRIIDEGFEVLSLGGLFVIYTGVTIPLSNPGFDPLLNHLKQLGGLEVLDYTILHPDMWPEEIGTGAYTNAARIQTIGTVVRKIR